MKLGDFILTNKRIILYSMFLFIFFCVSAGYLAEINKDLTKGILISFVLTFVVGVFSIFLYHQWKWELELEREREDENG